MRHEKPLGQGVQLLGLTGRAGAGKDTVATELIARYGFRQFAFAAKLKDVLSDAFDIPVEYFSDRDKKNIPHPHLCAAYISRKFTSPELIEWFEAVFDELQPAKPLVSADIAASAIFHNLLPHHDAVSPRRAAQVIGVQGFRSMLGDTVWIDYVLRQARAAIYDGVPVVISDVRFDDEFDVVLSGIDDIRGQMIGIRRLDGEEIHRDATEDRIDSLVDRSSILIHNDGTEPALRINAGYLVTNQQKLRYRMETGRYREIIRTLASGNQTSANMSQRDELFIHGLFSNGQMSRIGFLSDKEKQWLDDIWARASNDEHTRTNRPRAA